MAVTNLRNFNEKTYVYFQEFHFESPVKDSLKCKLCKKLLVDPLQLECGHRMCKPCLESLPVATSREAKLCPIDLEEIALYFPDRSALLQIIQLRVFCTFRKQGCCWVGMIVEFVAHLEGACKFASDWKVCDFSVIGCERKGFADAMREHYEKDCAVHLSCLAEVLKKLGIANGQARSVEESMSFTYNECQDKIKEDNDSLLAMRTSIQGFSADLDNVQSQLTRHSGLEAKSDLVNQESNVSTTLALAHVKDLGKCFESLEAEIGQIEIALSERKARTVDVSSNPTLITAQAESVSKLKSLEKERKNRKENLAEIDLKIRLFQATTYSGKYVWKIDNYFRRMTEAKEEKIVELFSPPLFSHHFGYRVSCKICLNGKAPKDGYGTHVAFYMILMKGEYDALLQFPFPRTFRATLLAEDQRHNIEKVIEPTSGEAFQRPAREMNTPVGYEKFVSHQELASGRYIWDGSLFLKIDFSK